MWTRASVRSKAREVHQDHGNNPPDSEVKWQIEYMLRPSSSSLLWDLGLEGTRPTRPNSRTPSLLLQSLGVDLMPALSNFARCSSSSSSLFLFPLLSPTLSSSWFVLLSFSLYLSILVCSLFFIFLSLYTYIYIYLSVCLSIYLSIYLSISPLYMDFGELSGMGKSLTEPQLSRSSGGWACLRLENPNLLK